MNSGSKGASGVTRVTRLGLCVDYGCIHPAFNAKKAMSNRHLDTAKHVCTPVSEFRYPIGDDQTKEDPP